MTEPPSPDVPPPPGESRVRRRIRATFTFLGFLMVVAGSFLLWLHAVHLSRRADPGNGGVVGMALALAGTGSIVIVNHLLGWKGLLDLFSRAFSLETTPREERELPGALITVGLLGAGIIGLFLVAGGNPTEYTGRGLARLLGMAVLGGVMLFLRSRRRILP